MPPHLLLHLPSLFAAAGQVGDVHPVADCDGDLFAHPREPPVLWHDVPHAAVVEGQDNGIPAAQLNRLSHQCVATTRAARTQPRPLSVSPIKQLRRRTFLTIYCLN